MNKMKRLIDIIDLSETKNTLNARTMKHTKGNWTIKERSDRYSINGEGWKDLASVWKSMHTKDEDFYNAKLIAAAPELLETLNIVLDQFKLEGEIDEELIERVINKATK